MPTISISLVSYVFKEIYKVKSIFLFKDAFFSESSVFLNKLLKFTEEIVLIV